MQQSACFTGHRSISGNILSLRRRLYKAIEKDIIHHEITDFYTGGAIGWDTLAAQVIFKIRESYPQVKLHLILPCSNAEQTEKWTVEQKKEFYRILSLADDVEYTSQRYFNGCMKVRNTRLVECATYKCYCYWNDKRRRSGTFQTINMAERKGLLMENFFE